MFTFRSFLRDLTADRVNLAVTFSPETVPTLRLFATLFILNTLQNDQKDIRNVQSELFCHYVV